MISLFQKKISPLIRRFIKLSPKDIPLEIPPKEIKADLSLPCFPFSSLIKRKPQEIALRFKKAFDDHFKTFPLSLIEKVESQGAYLNFYINFKNFSKIVVEEIFKEKFSFNLGRKKRIMIEYSQPNTHKEFHIGHLRNACLGYTLINLYKLANFEVVSATYMNDLGSHVALVLWYLQEKLRIKESQLKKINFGKIYSEATRFLETHLENKKRVLELEKRIEEKDKNILSLWKNTRKISLDDFKRIYKELGIKFDVWFFESDYQKAGRFFVKKLLGKGIAKISQGAVIVDLSKFNLDTLVLLRKDGTTLYSTKEIPLALDKFRKYKIKESYYVVDVRQKLYFKQIFKILELLNFKKKLVHIPYEFVTLPEGTISFNSS